MKRAILVLVLLASFPFTLRSANAQAVEPSVMWAVQAGGELTEWLNGLVTDNDGNVVITGSFIGTAYFGDQEVTAVGLDTAGPRDFFVAKYAPDGSLQWIRHSGGRAGQDSNWGGGVAVDGQNNVISAGGYAGTVVIDGVTLPHDGGLTDVFLLKYAPDGNVLWGRYAIGTLGTALARATATDKDGNIYITGAFAHHNYGGTITFASTTLTSYGGADMFLAKYAPDGTFLWARHAGSTTTGSPLGNYEYGNRLATDSRGNVIVQGLYSGVARFEDVTLSNAGDADVFVAKYDPNGTLLWVHSAGGSGREWPGGLAIDDQDHVLTTGTFSSPIQVGGTTLVSAGNEDIFVAEYDPDGNSVSAFTIGGSASDGGGIIAFDDLNNIMMTFHFIGSTDIGGSPLIGAGGRDAAVVNLTRTGSPLWTTSFGGTGEDFGRYVAIDAQGQVYAAGTFSGSADFGGVTLQSVGPSDIYIVKIEAASNEAPIAHAGGPYLGAVNTPIAFDGSASSDLDGDALTYTWYWGDGTSDTTSTHTFGAAEIYDVCLIVNDGQVDSEPDCTIAVVYDPNGGFVTGGGWIDSPAGAYKPDPALSGKATFGFVAKYKKGASIPQGNTEFQFRTAYLNFHSESYEWLVVTGSDYAKFKGVGSINGEGMYKFMIWAGDKSPDAFRIKIWTEDALGVESVVYDNGMDQPIGGGSIVVHSEK